MCVCVCVVCVCVCVCVCVKHVCFYIMCMWYTLESRARAMHTGDEYVDDTCTGRLTVFESKCIHDTLLHGLDTVQGRHESRETLGGGGRGDCH